MNDNLARNTRGYNVPLVKYKREEMWYGDGKKNQKK